ncbi:hypothetical protein [Asticcacaulis solisilvae]|uniref:hypothetical protein n=1 Tax=Asticcacaulis solisilvae TaxID=1217274 RepID=UPI003FD79A2B
MKNRFDKDRVLRSIEQVRQFNADSLRRFDLDAPGVAARVAPKGGLLTRLFRKRADPFAFSKVQIRTFLDDAYAASPDRGKAAGHEARPAADAYEELDQVAARPEDARRAR